MKKLILIVGVLIVCCITNSVVADQSTVVIRAMLHDPAKSDAQFFVGKPAEQLVPLGMTSEGLGNAQKIPVEDGKIGFYSSATVSKENPTANLVAVGSVPSGAARLIVFILPAPQGEAHPYHLLVMNDDPQVFPWGESRAVNLTAVDFALEVGEHKIVLPGGKITAVPKVTKVNEYNRAQTNFYYKKEDQWLIAAERPMQYVNTLRRVFLISKAPQALVPDVRTIVDTLPPVPDEHH